MSRLLVGSRVTSLPPTTTRPTVGVLEAGDQPQRGRLAAAGRPEQRDQLARRAGSGSARRARSRRRTSGAGPRAGPRRRSRSHGRGCRLAGSRAHSSSAATGRDVRRPAADEGQADEQDEREQQRGQRHRDRDGGVGAAERGSIATWRFSKLSRLAIVNSPSTSATDRSAALRSAARMFGTMIRHITVGQPRPEAARRLGQGLDVDGGEPGVERRGRRTAAPGSRRRSRASAASRRRCTSPRRRPARARRPGRWPGWSAAAGR